MAEEQELPFITPAQKEHVIDVLHTRRDNAYAAFDVLGWHEEAQLGYEYAMATLKDVL
jgi:hypothetical protein